MPGFGLNQINIGAPLVSAYTAIAYLGIRRKTDELICVYKPSYSTHKIYYSLFASFRYISGKVLSNTQINLPKMHRHNIKNPIANYSGDWVLLLKRV